ncbi:MAG: hypothetical protein V4550_21100 [Gemmatimonadota bacterium]
MLVVARVHATGAQTPTIPVQAGTAIERDTVTIGDVVRLTIRVHAPLGASINFPAAVDSLGPVQSLEPPTVRNGSDSASAADRVATYRVAAWDVGNQQIKLGEVLIQTDDGDRRISLDLPTVFVKSVLPADTALRIPKPARPLLEVKAPVPWWYWLVAAIAALVIGLVAWWWARKRRQDARHTGDAFADANAGFARIEKLKLVESGEPGRYVALMTDVVRRYLSERIESASLAQTSGELLAELRGARTVSFANLQQLLEVADAVKFAAAPIGAAHAKEVGEQAKGIVQEEHERARALAESAAEERAA